MKWRLQQIKSHMQLGDVFSFEEAKLEFISPVLVCELTGFEEAILQLNGEGKSVRQLFIGPENSFSVLLRDQIKNNLNNVVEVFLVSDSASLPYNSVVVLAHDDEIELRDALQSFIDKPAILMARNEIVSKHERGFCVVTFPKSGTHLLMNFLEITGMPNSGIWRGEKSFLGYKSVFTQNTHTSFSQYLTEETADAVRLDMIPLVFLYRHPLDILISYANYLSFSGDRMAFYFGNKSFEKRIKILLRGLSSIKVFPPFSARLREYLFWLELPNSIAVSFEELVGERGLHEKTSVRKKQNASFFQLAALWSMQLKLAIPGAPLKIAYSLNDGY